MPTEASGAFGAEGADGRGGGDSAEDWMPLRVSQLVEAGRAGLSLASDDGWTDPMD